MRFENSPPSGSSPSKKQEGTPLEVSFVGPKKIESPVNKFISPYGDNTEELEGILEFVYQDNQLARFEKNISPELESAIQQINQLLISFLQEWGLKEYVDITADHIILVDLKRDKELLESNKSEAGSYHSYKNKIRILIEWKLGRYRDFIRVLVHEMIHMQAYQSWQEDTDLVRPRRQGVRISHRDIDEKGYTKESYAWLDEAITEELTKQFLAKHERDISVLQGVRKPFVAIEKAKRVISQLSHLDFKDDGHVYREQRALLQKLITAIHIHGRKKYKSRDEVFQLFTNAALKGRLLPVARAIEKAKGERII